MTHLLVSKKDNGSQPDLQQALRKYEQPDLGKAVRQLSTTFIPYIILCVLMFFCYQAGFSYWIILGLSLVAGSLLVRIFIFFHDCAHKSFFFLKKRIPYWVISVEY
jgi:omega-6 fatty acid desaturase (delta-12 desaturase)